MIVKKLILFCWLSSVGLGLQVPFNLKSLQKPANNPVSDQVHYLTVEEQDLPINLLQYHSQKVIRLQLDKALKLYLFKEKHGLQFNVWGKHNQVIDLQIDDENLLKLIAQFPKLSYTTIIEDLPQAIYETYPKGENDEFNTVLLQLKEANELKQFHIADASFNMLQHQQYINEQFRIAGELFFKEYRPTATINAWLDLIRQSYPEVISIENIGQTYEHRDYNIVHFTVTNPEAYHEEKKTVVVTGGVHAREWISISSVLYTLFQLVVEYNNNPNSETLAALDFLFIPVANPDGYEYSWTNDRLWRKNRQETIHPQCFGIDIDHSYDFHWSKSSDWPCGEEYSGEEAFEAIESRIWDAYLNSTDSQHKIYGYLDLHSYSQEILYPYAYSCDEQPRDEENLIELAYGIAKTIRLVSGKNYNVLPACIDRDSDLLPDLGAGSALDFMYNKRAYWAFQLKLRDTGSHGFLLPAKYIEQVGHEIFAGVKYFCSFIVNDER